MIHKFLVAWLLLVWAWAATAQTGAAPTSCSTTGDLDVVMRENIERTAQQFANLAL